MPLSDTLYTLLSTNSGVGALTSQRVYPGILPHTATYPAIVLTIQGVERFPTFSGVSALTKTTVGVECWAATHSTALTLQDAVRRALEGVTASTYTTPISASFLLNMGDADDYDVDGDIYKTSLTFDVWHNST